MDEAQMDEAVILVRVRPGRAAPRPRVAPDGEDGPGRAGTARVRPYVRAVRQRRPVVVLPRWRPA
jgi:hypothetical protein